jgi:hypothetical protein
VIAVVVAVLFPAAGSAVVVATLAVFATLLPLGVEDASRSTIENVADAPGAKVAIVHVIVPVAPTLGLPQVKAGPTVHDSLL